MSALPRSQNAVTHGIFSTAAVLPGVESEAGWLAHRAGVLESLSPVGHLETVFADTVATLTWRLVRITRYETALAAVRQEQEFPPEFDRRFRRHAPLRSLPLVGGGARTPEMLRDMVAELAPLFTLPPDRRLEPADAEWLLALWMGEGPLADRADQDLPLAPLAVPGIPPDIDDLHYAWEGWTAGLLRDCLLAWNDRTGAPRDSAPAALSALLTEVIVLVDAAEPELRREMDAVRAEFLLPEPDLALKIARYEAHLNRRLRDALRELESLRAARRKGELQNENPQPEPPAASTPGHLLARQPAPCAGQFAICNLQSSISNAPASTSDPCRLRSAPHRAEAATRIHPVVVVNEAGAAETETARHPSVTIRTIRPIRVPFLLRRIRPPGTAKRTPAHPSR